ncbi:MAG: DUF1178 family protein [Ramlibacter sp.]|nr:DUF1178 family protein [Ramlibacter sp.]
MKVLNLQCASAHAFEGWFGSEDDFQKQVAAGQVECPLCGDNAIHKMPSAPRINLGAQRPETKHEVVNTPDVAMQAAWMRAVREVIAKTEDVGERFPEEARRMHYGEVEERGIRGEAPREEAEALLEEGIGVMPLPIPRALKEPLQ